jgi:D-beta-D-heptose 7-phosphate kinase/D-beta-D-heptose 1-phosphate adenosyltransferase
MNLQQKQLNVILIGDSCIDEYHYGNADRLSPEAPVPVFVSKRIETKRGMAANVEENLKSLGVHVQSYFGPDSIKTRMIDEKSKQHILRIDKDAACEALNFNNININNVDAFVVSDYNKGFVSYELIESLISLNKPVFIDTKKTDLKRFDGGFVKVNLTEFSTAKSLANNMIVTMGEHGAMWNQRKYNAPKIEIADVCGAGDTFLASFAYKYLLTLDIDSSIQFAIKAASITVQHIGVYAPTLQEIL